MSGTSTSTHYRKGLRKISNEEEFTIDFPLELRNLDYLRRIQNQVGRAFLQMNVVIKNIIIDQNQKDKELEAAEAFANAHKQQDDDQKHPLSPSDDNDDNDDNNDNNDNDVDIDDDSGALPHSPPSKISNSTLLESSHYYQAPYFTLKTLERCLRDLLDDGSSMLKSVQRRRSDSITSTHKGKLSKKTKLKIQKQVKKEKKMQLKYDSYIQKQIKYQTTWSLVLSRELSWLLDKVLWIQNIMKHIEETNMNPENSNVTDGKIKSDFQMAIDLLVVFGEANTECSCHLINIQTLRSQFVHHCTYRRERRHKEIMDEQKARGGTGTINNMNGVNDDGSFQFNYAYDFDRNGIIYYFGTISNNEEEPTTTTNEEGSKESIEHTKEELAVDDDRNWVNPSISTVNRKNPQIRAFRSSDGAGHSTDICNRKKGIYSCTDYREPRQYYGIDFGPYYRVYPNACRFFVHRCYCLDIPVCYSRSNFCTFTHLIAFYFFYN